MSLICSESGKDVRVTEKLFGVVHPLGKGYAVASSVISRIPESERRTNPCDPMEEGLNVHEGHSTANPTFGTWAWSTYRHGKFLFSVSKETSKKYLPKTRRKIWKDIRSEVN